MWPPSTQDRPLLSGLKKLGATSLKGVTLVALLGLLLSTCTFLQKQESAVLVDLDPQTKIFVLRNDSFTLMRARIYAYRFDLNWVVSGTEAHPHIDRNHPINSVYERGRLTDWVTLWWWRPLNLDLTRRLDFVEWRPDAADEPSREVYCLIVESRNWLTNTTTATAILTDRMRFGASPWGPSRPNSAWGGGYETSKWLLSVKDSLKSDCLAFYKASI
jgi:hypothetical protein